MRARDAPPGAKPTHDSCALGLHGCGLHGCLAICWHAVNLAPRRAHVYRMSAVGRHRTACDPSSVLHKIPLTLSWTRNDNGASFPLPAPVQDIATHMLVRGEIAYLSYVSAAILLTMAGRPLVVGPLTAHLRAAKMELEFQT